MSAGVRKPIALCSRRGPSDESDNLRDRRLPRHAVLEAPEDLDLASGNRLRSGETSSGRWLLIGNPNFGGMAPITVTGCPSMRTVRHPPW